MLFDNKMKELKAFLDKWLDQYSMSREFTLLPFVEKWGIEVRQELGLPETPTSKLSISFDSEVSLNKLPTWEKLTSGLYAGTINFENIAVEFLEQSEEDGSVKFELCGYHEPHERYGFMSYSMFMKMFIKIPEHKTILPDRP